MKKITFCLLLMVTFLTACSSNSSNDTNKLDDNNTNSNQVSATNSEDNSQEKISASTEEAKNQDKTKSNVKDNSNSQNNSTKKSNDNVKDKAASETNLAGKVKNYIINGQENKSEAQKIKWSATFLNKVDTESLYKKYAADGGNTNDLESFAVYITKNAPIPNDWQDLFKKDLYDTYGEKVSRLEPLNDDLYQAYVAKDGKEVPYVVVSSRTGYFHG